MKTKLIAPCGMNCNLCSGYLRDKNKCPGCREDSDSKSDYRARCIIKNCDHLKENNWKYCTSKCQKYPCARLKGLDKRYRTKYGMSMIENLENIKNNGIRRFINDEKKRWISGNKVFCVHNKDYYEIK
jgi:hypothetical protein